MSSFNPSINYSRLVFLGGLDYLEHVFTDEDCHRANMKTNSIGKWLEEEKPHWNMDKVKNPKQSKRAYHALTRYEPNINIKIYSHSLIYEDCPTGDG